MTKKNADFGGFIRLEKKGVVISNKGINQTLPQTSSSLLESGIISNFVSFRSKSNFRSAHLFFRQMFFARSEHQMM